MKKKSHIVFLTFAATAVLQGCQTKETARQATQGGQWAGKMQGMAAEVKRLIPFLYSQQAFNDPVNAPQIKADLKKFATQAHAISPEMGKGYFGQDPMLSYSLENLQSDLSRAYEAFDQGRTEYARSVAKAATTHCVSCHSLTKEGQRAGWDLNQFSALPLTPLERVDLIIATRRYEEASLYLETLLANRDYIQTTPFDFESALRKYLSLMIRAEHNPTRPLHKLNRILEIKEVPYYISEQARSWRNSLQEWEKGKKRKTKSDLLTQARERIQRAVQVQQFAKDHAGDIEYLRATDLLHEYLRVTKGAKGVAQAYYLLGQAYEVLDELGHWNLHETYYESCIKAVPHSDLAKKCYGRLESSIYAGFSGSSGVHIPSLERQRLKTLKEMTL